MQKNKIQSDLVQELSYSENANIEGGNPIIWFLGGMASSVFFEIACSPSESWDIYSNAYRNA